MQAAGSFFADFHKLYLDILATAGSLQASVELADEVLAAVQANSAASNALKRNSKVQAYEQDYWAAMSNGTGETFTGTYNGLGVKALAAISSIREHAYVRAALSDLNTRKGALSGCCQD